MPRALDSAFRLLAKRSHFSSELRRKLLSRGFTEVEVEGALSRLRELGYLDDEAVLNEAVELAVRRGWGPLKLEWWLLSRGVEEEVAKRGKDRLVGSWLEAAENALKAVRARLARAGGDGEKRRKILAGAYKKLVSRGFYSEQAAEAVQKILDAEEDWDEAAL